MLWQEELISIILEPLTHEILFLPLKDKIHISLTLCVISSIVLQICSMVNGLFQFFVLHDCPGEGTCIVFRKTVGVD